MALDQAAAERILRSYSGKKLNTTEARRVLREWALSKGMTEDRWGNFHLGDGHRVKLTKQRMRVETKAARGWSLVESYALIEAAYRAIRDAGVAAGQEDVAEKARDAMRSRRTSKKKQRERRLSQAKRDDLEKMAAMIASSEDPALFYSAEDGDDAGFEAFIHRKQDLMRELEGLEEIGRPVDPQEMFSAQKVPVALLRVEGDVEWDEEVDGVTYTIRIAHAGRNKATVEIGSSASAGGTHIGVDPMGRSMGYGAGRSAKGDAYVSGYVDRPQPRTAPVGILFMILSHTKQRGAGSRVLDIWCDLMASFGAERWMAKAVGDEGRAFFAARVRAGRLRRLGSRGNDIAFECEAPSNGQQDLGF